MKPILEVNNVGKKFRIRHVAGGYLSLRERLASVLRFEKNNVEDFWALDNVCFDVKPGEAVGIIGRNGAGKSTLLKVLSKITPPTKGKIISRGRIASLLEVGTGFHPELTGRENIFFNGSLLGMKRKEIESKFDEIIDFSGVEKFLDTPLKHYSSGMQLRLAFAVAAFLEPEILIIDEVLAVGDAEFQKKCIGKMEDVSKSGRTILFVSHNMAAVQSLCSKAIWLHSGKVKSIDAVSSIIAEYQTSNASKGGIILFKDRDLWLSDFSAEALEVKQSMQSDMRGSFVISVDSKVEIESAYIGVGVNDILGIRLFTVFSRFYGKKYKIEKGKNTFTCTLERVGLKPGIYVAEVYVGDGAATAYLYYNQNLQFEVFASEQIDHMKIPDQSQGYFMVKQEWN
jgi:lipopolysaccharide transport system ATP-binding protein